VLYKSAYRDEVIQGMVEFMDICLDQPVWVLDQLFLVRAKVQARGDRLAQKELGRRVLRLEIVHEHVAEKLASLTWVDSVSVYLRFERELRDRLDLPVSDISTTFWEHIDVRDEELEAASDAALAVTDEDLVTWLEKWPEWVRHER